MRGFYAAGEAGQENGTPARGAWELQLQRGGGWDQSLNKDRKELYPKKKLRCGSGKSEIAGDGKGKCRPAHRPNDSNLVRAGWTRGPVDPSVESNAVMIQLVPGSAIALWRTNTLDRASGSSLHTMMTAAHPLAAYTSDPSTSRRLDTHLASTQNPPLEL